MCDIVTQEAKFSQGCRIGPSREIDAGDYFFRKAENPTI
jgi:hypothetical protein